MLQKRLAAQILKCSPHRIRFDPEQMEDIKAAITKADVRRLILGQALTVIPVATPSRARARHRHLQRQKGRQRGVGTRKGTKNARFNQKRVWIEKIRAQKALLLRLKESKKISPATYRELYRKAKGGFFRSLRHIQITISERK